MESTPDTSSAKRTRAKPRVVVKDPVGGSSPAGKTASAAAKKPRTPRKTPTKAPAPEAATGDVTIVAASLESTPEPKPSPEDVGHMIATAAYYLAAARNFTPGHELDDWLEAERTIHAKLYG
jgi:hypothetical protein